MPHLMERQGWECGAVVASHGSAGYYKAPLRSRDAWEDAQGAGLSEGRRGATPFSPSSSPGGLRWDARQALLLALARRWTWSAVLGGWSQGELGPGWAAGPGEKPTPPPPICHGPAAVAPPECEALASTPPLQPNPLGQVGVKGAGGGGRVDAVPPPPMTTASQGGQGTLAGPAFPGSLSAICARVVKGVN